MEKLLNLNVPKGVVDIVLHTCCAPCSSAIIECMLANELQPVIFYYNPNIYPQSEYEKRKKECTRYAKFHGLTVVDGDYDYSYWKNHMDGLENEPERGRRCLKCFGLRLLETARFAAENKYTMFTTTLVSSRWKSLEQINKAGLFAAASYPGMVFWEQNWRKGGLSERRKELISQHNFYNQQYCGCEYSQRNSY